MILRDKDTKLVLYVGDLILNEDGLSGHNFKAVDIKPTKHELINVGFPPDFIGHHYTYDESEGWKRTELGIERLREITIKKIKEKAREKSTLPVTINNITYNGGDSSAAAINGACNIAEVNGETVVVLWDYYNVNAEYDLQTAKNIALTIANTYSSVMYERNDKLKAASVASEEELLEM